MKVQERRRAQEIAEEEVDVIRRKWHGAPSKAR